MQIDTSLRMNMKPFFKTISDDRKPAVFAKKEE